MGVVECMNHNLVEPFNVLYEKEGEEGGGGRRSEGEGRKRRERGEKGRREEGIQREWRGRGKVLSMKLEGVGFAVTMATVVLVAGEFVAQFNEVNIFVSAKWSTKVRGGRERERGGEGERRKL